MSIPRNVHTESMSERVRGVLGLPPENPIPRGEFEPTEWVDIVNGVMRVVKPYLERYRYCFKEISDFENKELPDSKGGFFKRETPHGALYFQPGSGLSKETRCVMVTLLRDPPPSKGGDMRTEKHLFLTQEGKWGYWEAKYELRVLGFSTNWIPTEIAKNSRFLLFEDRKLFSTIFEMFPKAGKETLEMFYSLMNDAADKKIAELENELARVKADRQKLQNIMGRIL